MAPPPENQINENTSGLPPYGPSVVPEKEVQIEKLEYGVPHDEVDNKSIDKDDLDDTPAAIAALNMPDWREQEKKIVRTLDLAMMPMLWILYLFNYLDRGSIG